MAKRGPSPGNGKESKRKKALTPAQIHERRSAPKEDEDVFPVFVYHESLVPLKKDDFDRIRTGVSEKLVSKT